MAEIGSTLREARMRARIDISEVETSTKIRAKYLRALENEEWGLLPGPVFIRSFLKTYGDYLGLDSRLLIDEFKRRYEMPMEQEAGPIATSHERERQHRPRRITGLLMSPRSVIGIALVVIVVALYLIGSHVGSQGNGNVNTAQTHRRHRNAGSAKTSKRHHKHAGTTTDTTTTGTTPRTSKVTLALVPTGTIWVCVENGSGRPLTVGEYSSGQKIPTESADVLLVTLGSANVDIAVNGKSYTTPSTVPAGLRITPGGVRPLSPAPKCGQ